MIGADLDALAASLHLPKRGDGEPDAEYRERLNGFVKAFNSLRMPGETIRFKRPDFTEQERTHYDRKPRAEREEARRAQVMAVLDPNWKGRGR